MQEYLQHHSHFSWLWMKYQLTANRAEDKHFSGMCTKIDEWGEERWLDRWCIVVGPLH